jgi:hypothetical protein
LIFNLYGVAGVLAVAFSRCVLNARHTLVASAIPARQTGIRKVQ